MLVITPRAKKGAQPTGFRIRLLPCIAPGTFPAARLAPGRNNLRAAVGGAGEGAAAELLPTPHYNAAILRVCGRAIWLGRSLAHTAQEPFDRGICCRKVRLIGISPARRAHRAQLLLKHHANLPLTSLAQVRLSSLARGICRTCYCQLSMACWIGRLRSFRPSAMLCYCSRHAFTFECFESFKCFAPAGQQVCSGSVGCLECHRILKLESYGSFEHGGC